MSPRSTAEIAAAVGVDRSTLERWLAERRVPMPKQVRVGTRYFRLWSERDVERVKKYKAAHYRKGRGRKKKEKKP